MFKRAKISLLLVCTAGVEQLHYVTSTKIDFRYCPKSSIAFNGDYGYAFFLLMM